MTHRDATQIRNETMLSQFISKNRLTNVSGIVWFLQLYNLSLQMILIENKIIIFFSTATVSIDIRREYCICCTIANNGVVATFYTNPFSLKLFKF